MYVLWAGERSVESRVRENLTHGSGGGVRKHVALCDGAPHAYLTTSEQPLERADRVFGRTGENTTEEDLRASWVPDEFLDSAATGDRFAGVSE